MRHNIGVIDSGMGGLTVVRSLSAMRAPVDITYVGDNANVPYGNRSLDEIVRLTLRMLGVLDSKGVEAVAIACNTISATVDRLREATKLPLIDIISPGAEFVASCGESDVGLFATEFTVKSGLHAAYARRLNPEVRVHGVASPTLAALIDASPDDETAIRREISSMLARLAAASSAQSASPIHTVLLGCTHYPLVMDIFRSLAPGVDFIDPADLQARAVLALVEEGGAEIAAARGSAHSGASRAGVAQGPTLEVVTSGSFDAYRAMLERLGIPEAKSFQKLEA